MDQATLIKSLPVVEKAYLKALLDSQPLLVPKETSKQDEDVVIPTKANSIRMPVSVALLDAVTALKNPSLEEKDAQLVMERVKELVENYTKKLDLQSMDCEAVAALYQDPDSTGKKDINWRSVVLKIHQAIVENKPSYEMLSNLVKVATMPATEAKERTTEKTESSSDEQAFEEEEDETTGSLAKESAFAKATSSMAWTGGPPPTGLPPSMQPKGPQLLKSSPFIPIKATKKKKVEEPTKTGTTPARASLTSSTDKSPFPPGKLTLADSDEIAIVTPGLTQPITTSGNPLRSSKSFEGSLAQQTPSPSGLASALKSPTPVPMSTTPRPGLTQSKSYAPMIDPALTTLPSTSPSMAIPQGPGRKIEFATSPPAFGGLSSSLPSSLPTSFTSSMPSTAMYTPVETGKPQQGNLPPSRLSEAAMRTLPVGQSFFYSKAPLIDPLKQLPSSDTTVTSEALQQQAEDTGVFIENPHTADLIVYPASYFRRKENSELRERLAIGEVTITHESVSLPKWLDIVVYWGKPTPSNGMSLQLESIVLALNSAGHYDYLLQAAISHLIYTAASNSASDKTIPSSLKDLLASYVQNYSSIYPESKAAEKLRTECQSISQRVWNTKVYDKFLSDLVAARFDFQLEKLLDSLESDLLLHLRAKHPSLRFIERILISLLGHEIEVARERAVKLLNILYDGHDWQRTEALIPAIRYIGDAFVVELDFEGYSIDQKNVYLLVYSPNLHTTKSGYGLSRFIPAIIDEHRLVMNIGNFKQAGYYDWRFAYMDPDGQFIPLLSHTGGKKLAKVQGRVIVHPSLRDEVMHEVFAEVHESEWDKRSDTLIKKGNFASVMKALPEFKRMIGITSLYVMGALDRARGANPLVPTDKALPNRWLGGVSDFDQLVAAAKEQGIKIVVDSTARLAAKGTHRKYRNLICQMIDMDTDHLKPHPGTDGRDFQWNDSVHLNFRKKATWDLLVSEIQEWASRGVSGVRLDAAHSWPLILKPNTYELLREDNDGKYHYSLQEIVDGEVVLPVKDEAETYGYWGTEASTSYPNPLFIKLSKEIWRNFPNFFFLAEVYWNREHTALSSGLIPYANALPRALASLFSIGIHKEGVTYLNERKNVSALYDWYAKERIHYPQNSVLVYPSSSHFLPYPTSIYGPASWAAVDLLYFLPELPMTYHPEWKGWTMNIDITKNRFVAPDLDKSMQRIDFSPIKGHYEHRSMMRRTYPVLREGGMIPLFAYSAGGWHDRVFAFARFTKKQMAIIAINLNDVDSIVYVDHSPLKEICDTSEKVIYRIVDFINPTNPPQYYSSQEFLYEKKYIRLTPFSTICWGVYVQADSLSVQRVLYEHSLNRLSRILSLNLDPTHNMIYTLITNGMEKISNFTESMKKILDQSGPGGDASLPPTLQYVLYHATKPKLDGSAKALGYLTHLSSKSADRALNNLCYQILQCNIMGPIVFVTPELGRFSTVGGVGVMVNELTQAMAALGLDIHIISPYYNFNRKGKTGYLEAEGIHWLQNIVTYVGNEHVEIGVHQGKEHGVNLHFLHNYTYFPTPYATGSPVYQLDQIVLMAKGSLEMCCQLRILPSLVITNDWFTALVPAYAKRSGAFGTTFSGTTFFHLIHNLEEGYEGKIYVDGNDDLGYIHQLARDLIAESYPGGVCLNASRCALLSCDQWGTVSTSYRDDLIRTSPLGPLLARFPQPFGKQNGIRLEERLALLKTIAKDHDEAKAMLQKKYFGESDPTIPIFAFIGRIVLQKGVHLILNAVRELVEFTKGRIQILIGGMANMKDPYAAQCAWSIQALRKQFPKHFWGDPNEFFVDGALVNYGADFGLMPSLFEPSGVVQQEFFAGGTPVIAFKTGGLKDSVFEFDNQKNTGNGFTFEAHTHGDFVYAVHRAAGVFNNKEAYAKLRRQARESVLDVEEIAVAWIKEYARLRNRMWAHPKEVAHYAEDQSEETKKDTKSLTSPSVNAQSATTPTDERKEDVIKKDAK